VENTKSSTIQRIAATTKSPWWRASAFRRAPIAEVTPVTAWFARRGIFPVGKVAAFCLQARKHFRP
jgi:uncharacterized protein (DUF3820 family)